MQHGHIFTILWPFYNYTVFVNIHDSMYSCPSIWHVNFFASPTLMNSRDPPCGICLVPVLIILRLQKYFSWWPNTLNEPTNVTVLLVLSSVISIMRWYISTPLSHSSSFVTFREKNPDEPVNNYQSVRKDGEKTRFIFFWLQIKV